MRPSEPRHTCYSHLPQLRRVKNDSLECDETKQTDQEWQPELRATKPNQATESVNNCASSKCSESILFEFWRHDRTLCAPGAGED